MTNEQAVMDAENKISILKQNYMNSLRDIIGKRTNNQEILLDDILNCQQLGNNYFNFIESFVGSSGLLGAHYNGKWVTGFAETCLASLDSIIEHYNFLNSYSNLLGGKTILPSKNAYANMQRMAKEYLPKKDWSKVLTQYESNGLPVTGFKHAGASDSINTPTWKLITGLVIGIIFAVTILVLAVLIPNPTIYQIFIFRGIFAISMAAIAAIIPGFLNISSRTKSFTVKAGGAIAVFIIVWLVNPPALVAPLAS